jgi:hypothetical protein
MIFFFSLSSGYLAICRTIYYSQLWQIQCVFYRVQPVPGSLITVIIFPPWQRYRGTWIGLFASHVPQPKIIASTHRIDNTFPLTTCSSRSLQGMPIYIPPLLMPFWSPPSDVDFAPVRANRSVVFLSNITPASRHRQTSNCNSELRLTLRETMRRFYI